MPLCVCACRRLIDRRRVSEDKLRFVCAACMGMHTSTNQHKRATRRPRNPLLTEVVGHPRIGYFFFVTWSLPLTDLNCSSCPCTRTHTFSPITAERLGKGKLRQISAGQRDPPPLVLVQACIGVCKIELGRRGRGAGTKVTQTMAATWEVRGNKGDGVGRIK